MSTAARIAEIQEKLAEIAELKKLEPKLKKELEELEAQAGEDDDEEDDQQEEEEVEEEEPAPAPEPVAAVPEPEPVKQASPEEVRLKKIKALNKKLQQIAALKGKGGLDPEAQAKVDREPLIKKQIACLKEGKDLPDENDDEEPPAPPPEPAEGSKTVALPADPAEREKRVKALKKKLAQITALKEKDGPLDKEAQEKVDSERTLLREVAALEAGDAELVLGPPTDSEKYEIYLSAKHELERKIKAITKKLGAIDGHKGKDELDNHAKAKVENEASLKKEKGELERRLGALNKEEALRVAKRLDFEADHHAHHEEKKASKKKKGR